MIKFNEQCVVIFKFLNGAPLKWKARDIDKTIRH